MALQEWVEYQELLNPLNKGAAISACHIVTFKVRNHNNPQPGSPLQGGFCKTKRDAIEKLWNHRGELTARGRQMYTQPEITVEVPATQVGVGRLGEFELETARVFTANEHPDIGAWFRPCDNGRNAIQGS